MLVAENQDSFSGPTPGKLQGAFCIQAQDKKGAQEPKEGAQNCLGILQVSISLGLAALAGFWGYCCGLAAAGPGNAYMTQCPIWEETAAL